MRLTRDFLKFCIVGVLNTAINLLLLYLMTDLLGLYYIYSAVIAYFFAVTNSFIFNTFWTFKKDLKHKTVKRYSKFFIVSSVAAILNILILYFFTEYIGLWYMFSQAIAIGLTLIINFFGNKSWTYD